MIRPKIETDLLSSTTKNCGTLIKQTHTKIQEVLEFKLTKPRETFHFNPPKTTERSWMKGLTSVKIYKSIFKITEESNKFELYTDSCD